MRETSPSPDSVRDPVRLALLLTLWIKVCIAAAAPAEDLFVPAGPVAAEAPVAVAAASAAVASEYLGPTLRYRHARIDPVLLVRARAAAERGEPTVGLIDLNLFEGTSFRVADLRAAPTSVGYSLAGELEGVPLSAVTLVVNRDVIAGEVRLPGATYTIRSVGDVVEIRETDEQALPEGAEPRVPPPALAGAVAPARDLPSLGFQASTMLTYVDVLVVYTTAAKDKAGGEGAMETLIDLWIAAANGYLGSSGVDLRIRLAHAEELDYVETASSFELTPLRRKGDGFMDEVHAMRDAVGADLVHLIERWGFDGTQRYCGIAYVMRNVDASFAEYAFGVTDINCGSVTFAHELGHNMGLNHDRYAQDIYFSLTNRPYAHAHGYVNQEAFVPGAPSSKRWVTIMAYTTQCRHARFGCSRIGRFSNPAQTHVGDPLGVWGNGVASAVAGPADSVATLNETRATVAAWRSAASGPRVVSLKRRTPADERTSGDSLTWRLTFSEDVRNVTSDDFELLGSSLGTTTLAATAKAGSQRSYDVAVTGGVDSFDGVVTLGFASGQDIRNLSDVDLVASWPAHAERTYTLDNTAPTPSISPSSAGSSPFAVTITFGEDVTGFSDAADVTASGATVTAPTRSDARTYTIQVTPSGSTAATITLSVVAAAATDLAGNDSAAASQNVAWDPSTASSLTVSAYSDGTVAENMAWTSATPATGGSPSGSVYWTKEGADADLFTINSSTGVLGLPGQDYEKPADADSDRQFEVTARATDAKGNSATAGVNVTVTDAVEKRSVSVERATSQKILDGSSYLSWPFLACQHYEDCRQAGAISPVTWTRTGADGALFSLSRNGAFRLRGRDFEAPGDADQDNDYWATLEGADSDGNTASKTVKVQVIKGPPGWLAVSGVSSGTVADGSSWTSSTPTAPGASGTVTWTREGPDATRFSVGSAGVLTLAAQDYDNPADANGDNVYEVLLRATDTRGNSGTAQVAVTVSDKPAVTITKPAATITAGSSPVTEGTATEFTVTLSSAAPAGGLAVALTVADAAGSDFVASGNEGSKNLAFNTGDTSHVYSVATVADSVDEASGPVQVTIGAGTGYTVGTPASASVTVNDDDDPEVTARFGSSSYELTEGQSVDVVVRLDRDPERDVEIFLDYTHHGGTRDADYRGVPDSVEFNPGVTSRSFQVTATDDADDDDGEAVELSLSTAASRVTADDRTTIAIRDNDSTNPGGGGPPPGGGGGGPPPPDPEPDPEPDPDPPPPPPPPPPTVSVSASEASESAGAVVFDVRLGRSSGSVVTVDYATADGAGGAKAGQDYTATAGTLRFAAGSRAERIRVPVTDDGQYEAASETFTLTLRRPVNARLAGGDSVLRVPGTIHDDDDGPPSAAFELIDSRCDEELCRARTGARVGFVDTSTGKVLSRLWEFGDGRTSRSRRVRHAWSSPGFYRVTLSVSDGATTSTVGRVFLVEAAAPVGTCVADAGTRCLRDSRYAVSVEWLGADGEGGNGGVVHEGTNDSGMFRFFDRDNWEVLIKVLDGCSVNGHVWVFGASPTDLGYVIRVTDTVTGAVKEYRNEPGRPAAAITDVTAFPDGCRP